MKRCSSKFVSSLFEVAPVSRTTSGIGLQQLDLHVVLVAVRRAIVQSGAQADGVVSSLDEAEARNAGLSLGCEPTATQQLAFEGGEEALAHGVDAPMSVKSVSRARWRMSALAHEPGQAGAKGSGALNAERLDRTHDFAKASSAL